MLYSQSSAASASSTSLAFMNTLQVASVAEKADAYKGKWPFLMTCTVYTYC